MDVHCHEQNTLDSLHVCFWIKFWFLHFREPFTVVKLRDPGWVVAQFRSCALLQLLSVRVHGFPLLYILPSFPSFCESLFWQVCSDSSCHLIDTPVLMGDVELFPPSICLLGISYFCCCIICDSLIWQKFELLISFLHLIVYTVDAVLRVEYRLCAARQVLCWAASLPQQFKTNK